jgi:hypothetical protein
MSNVFLDHALCQTCPLGLMLEEVAYELSMRDRVYPRLVELGKLSQVEAEAHYRALVGVQQFLQSWSQMEMFTSQEAQHALQKIHDHTL